MSSYTSSPFLCLAIAMCLATGDPGLEPGTNETFIPSSVWSFSADFDYYDDAYITFVSYLPEEVPAARSHKRARLSA